MTRTVLRFLVPVSLIAAFGTAMTVPATATATARPGTDQQTIYMMDDITAVFEQSASSPRYANIENDNDGCGWTAGWIGFCTATGDMLDLVKQYDAAEPDNVLAKYTATLQQLADAGSDDTSSLGSAFPDDWKQAAQDPAFVQLQLKVGHDTYLTPAQDLAAKEGVKTNLGLENLFDTALMMGLGPDDCDGMVKIASETDSALGGNPASGVDEARWLSQFNTIRQQHMTNPCTPGRQNDWPQAVDRSQALQQLADQGNWDLTAPLTVGADFNITITDPHD
ncbi:chitosanase [Streptomyces silvisoli]|uniref:Chitosanase n=1 Tax=Streptomyces silvisoli TaxID=3034235 RepID=A0ABT5ZII9_9ACTN|nr:chitosanase [Streptomyces silvisoli]MDF3289648.1 chitosanase [Streptomyces silvisoli]